MVYGSLTNEELADMVQSGKDTDAALSQLFVNLRPVILGEAKMYQGKMVTYDADDFLQEGFITIWKSAMGFKGGSYLSYFKSAVRFHFINLFRSYTAKNLVCIAETEDFQGNGYNTQTLVVSDYAERQREKHREECRRSYAKRKAEKEAERIRLGLPKPERKPRKPRESRFTEAEKLERHRASARAYYEDHKDEQLRKRRERYAARKLAMAAAV